MRLLRAAALAAGALLAPAAGAHIGVREARAGSIRGSAPHHFDFARSLSAVFGAAGAASADCGNPDGCCVPEGDDESCTCGPTCPVGEVGGFCLCGTCVDDEECAANSDKCTENCFIGDNPTPPIYMSLTPSAAWLKLYDVSGGANVVFGKGGKKKVCDQHEVLQTRPDRTRTLEIVKRVEDALGDDGCRTRRAARNKLNPEIGVSLKGLDSDYLIRVHTSCSKPILYIGANYTQTTGDEDYLTPRDGDPLNSATNGDVFLTLTGFCIAPGNKQENLICSGDALPPDVPQGSCPPPGAGLPPTLSPSTAPTTSPTKNPTESPTKNPTESPTKNPTESPTKNPTESPTKNPTESPTKSPTESPTQNPTESPTKNPTESPTKSPTESPTQNPTESPTTSSPTTSPSCPPPVEDGRVEVAGANEEGCTPGGGTPEFCPAEDSSPCLCGECVNATFCDELNIDSTEDRCSRQCGGGCDFLQYSNVPDSLIVQICQKTDNSTLPADFPVAVTFKNCESEAAAAQYNVNADGSLVIDPGNPVVDNSENCGNRGYKINPDINIYPTGEFGEEKIYIHGSCSMPLFMGAKFTSEFGNYKAVVIGYQYGSFPENRYAPVDCAQVFRDDGPFCDVDHT